MPARLPTVWVLAASVGVVLSGCGSSAALSPQQEQKFLNSVYSQAPDISSYRTGAQLVTLGQAVCDDLKAGASVQQVADRLPLSEGATALPPNDLGVVIAASVGSLCPQFHGLLGQ